MQSSSRIRDLVAEAEALVYHAAVRALGDAFVQVIPFGSRACGLALETSDLDLVMVLSSGCCAIQQRTVLSQLSTVLRPHISTQIVGSHVLVLRFALGGGEWPPLEVDVSVETELHTGRAALQITSHLTEQLPPLRELVLALKRIMRDGRSASDVSLRPCEERSMYKGGVSSHALVIMCAAAVRKWLHEHTSESVPKETDLLMAFFCMWARSDFTPPSSHTPVPPYHLAAGAIPPSATWVAWPGLDCSRTM